jgi:hypothetical protein
MKSVRQICCVATALAVRPDLWFPAAALAARLVPNQWWRFGPFPPRAYLDYRGNAVYGMPLIQIPADEFIRYLEWCKAFPGPIR